MNHIHYVSYPLSIRNMISLISFFLIISSHFPDNYVLLSKSGKINDLLVFKKSVFLLDSHFLIKTLFILFIIID